MPTRSALRSLISVLLLVLSLLSVVTLIWSMTSGKSGSTLLALFGSVTVFLGHVKQLVEQKGDAKAARKTRRIGFAPPVVEQSFRLAPSFKSGIYGGLFGGGLSGLIIGISYYLRSASGDRPLGLGSILEIFIFA